MSRKLDDGFGNEWRKCWRPWCGLEIVRPGKVQCYCDSGDWTILTVWWWRLGHALAGHRWPPSPSRRWLQLIWRSRAVGEGDR